MNIDRLKERLGRIIFRLEWQSGRYPGYGTGFFISRKGLALTAFHNLPEAFREDPTALIKAKFRNQEITFRWTLREQPGWQEQLDVAVLEVWPKKPMRFPTARMEYLDGWDRQERGGFWKGKSMALMGFPLGAAYDARLILGSISIDEPIVDPKIIDEHGKPVLYAFQSLALGDNFQRECQEIQGVSGAPLMDTETGKVIGVQFAAWPDRQRVFATEFHHLAREWPAFRKLARNRPKPRRLLSWFAIATFALMTWLLAWQLMRPITPAAAFLRHRPGAAPANIPVYESTTPVEPASRRESMLGVTVWLLRAGAAVRASSEATYAKGDHVRVAIESPQTGFLYVIDREQYAGGAVGEPHLIFPTLRIRVGDNRVSAGRLIQIPDQADTPPYFTLDSQAANYTGERLSILVTPQPLDGIALQRNAQPVTPGQWDNWKQWLVEAARLDLKGGAGQPSTEAERSAGRGERELRQDEIAPQTLYRVPVAPGRPFMVDLSLSTLAGPSPAR